MTETNPNDYPRLSAEDINAHVTNILLGLASRKVNPLDWGTILTNALSRVWWPDINR